MHCRRKNRKYNFEYNAMSNINLEKIKQSARVISSYSESQRNLFLIKLADELILRKKQIILANIKDVQEAMKVSLNTAFIQRLIMNEKNISDLVKKIVDLTKLNSELGKDIHKTKCANGLLIKKVRVALGVIFVIYESRPDVTVEVASLCIKTGNSVILKGGSEAIHTNIELYACIKNALKHARLSADTVQFVSKITRATTEMLLKQNKFIDLVIARGGYDMVKHVMSTTTIPVLAHAAGGARIYIDKSADVSIVKKIILNAKASKPAACNSLDTIVIHRSLASTLLPIIQTDLKRQGVRVVKNNWDREFLDLQINIKITNNIDQAISFINSHTKHHSEGIIAQDKKAIAKFTDEVDAAALFINCSTRFHDGYEFGLGSEMGIATGKFHARGPVGLKELTTYKWEVYGNGQIRV